MPLDVACNHIRHPKNFSIMKKIILSIVFSVFTMFTFGQAKFKPDEKYLKHSSRAYKYFEDKKYLQSALSYDTLFKSFKGQGLRSDKYNAACSWALAENTSKAFSYLNKAIIIDKWANLSHILTDTDLNALHSDKRWQTLINKVKSNKEADEAKLNKPLVALLDTIYREDQNDRMNYEPVLKQYGWKSPQMDSLWKRINYFDSVNLIRVKNIIDTHGWLGPDVIGQQGASTIFLVIQHADSLTQVQYVPKMREAVKEGKAQSQNLALLEDRILMNQGKPQIYGSQVRLNEKTGKNEFFPIGDEPNVNKRRASVGLQPLEDYAKLFHFEYVLPQKVKDDN
jgi:hypothetical protein